MTAQPSQPLLRNFSDTRISVFPEEEEFLLELHGTSFLSFLLLMYPRCVL